MNKQMNDVLYNFSIKFISKMLDLSLRGRCICVCEGGGGSGLYSKRMCRNSISQLVIFYAASHCKIIILFGMYKKCLVEGTECCVITKSTYFAPAVQNVSSRTLAHQAIEHNQK